MLELWRYWALPEVMQLTHHHKWGKLISTDCEAYQSVLEPVKQANTTRSTTITDIPTVTPMLQALFAMFRKPALYLLLDPLPLVTSRDLLSHAVCKAIKWLKNYWSELLLIRAISQSKCFKFICWFSRLYPPYDEKAVFHFGVYTSVLFTFKLFVK